MALAQGICLVSDSTEVVLGYLGKYFGLLNLLYSFLTELKSKEVLDGLLHSQLNISLLRFILVTNLHNVLCVDRDG